MHLPGFPGWQFIDQQEDDHDIRLKALAPHMLMACPDCKSSDQFFRHGRREQLFMDTPLFGKRLGLLIQRQRYRCKACNRVFFQPLPEMDEKRIATRRLVEFVQTQAVVHSFMSVAEDVGIDEKSVRNIFSDYIEGLDKISRWENSDWIGFDEVYVGGKYRCVITDLRKRTVLDLLPDRTYATVADAVYRKAVKPVRAVCMDMHEPYRQVASSWLDQAAVVADKFHVIQLVTDAFVAVRKRVARRLTKKQRNTLRKESKELLLVNRHRLDAMQQIRRDEWLGNFPELKAAYDLKEEFSDIYLVGDKAEALRRYSLWKQKVRAAGIPPFPGVANTLDNWQSEFLNYFDHPQVTNAYTESANGLIKLANLMGRGYSFEVLRAKCLFSLGHFKIKRPKFQKRWSPPPLGEIDLSTRPHERESQPYVVLGVPVDTLIEKFKQGDL